MAKQLSLNNIQTGQAIEAAHVSQSINALTGTEAYDITISGSLEVIGPLTASGDIKINPSQSPNGTSVLTVDNNGKIFKTGSYGGGGGETGTGFPFSGSAEITGSLLISQSGLIVTGSTQIYGSGSTIFEVQGSRGVLFSIDDDESDNKLFSVNNVTGVPVLEVYQDNTVKLGKNNGYGIIITGSGVSASDLDANIIITGSIYQTGSNVVFSSNITSSGNVEINKGILSIKNNGSQSVARFYCEDDNQHYTELKAQPHALYSGNPITLLPAYNFDFAAPNFQANITASGNISASGYISASNLNLSESITATNIYATNLVVTNITSSFITSSTIVTSGSNTFGDELSDIQTLIGSTIITGSISVSGSVINNLTSSNAISSSYSLTASYVENAQSASYVLNAISASFANTASYVLNAVSASFANTALTANSSSQATSASYALTASHALNVSTPTLQEVTDQGATTTNNIQITGSGTNSTLILSGSSVGVDSYNGTYIWRDSGDSGIVFQVKADDGSNMMEIVNNNDLGVSADWKNGSGVFFKIEGGGANSYFRDGLKVGGTGLNSGGHIFQVVAGSTGLQALTATTITNNSTVAGTRLTGSFTGSFTGDLDGTAATASYVTLAQTASYVENAQTASYVETAQTASYVLNAVSSSYALTASYVENAQTASYVETAQTASYVLNAVSSSYALTASYVENAQTASYVETAQTASYVETAQTASYVETAQTASYVETAQTASYVLNAVSSSYALSASYSDTASHALNVSTPTLQEVTTAGQTTSGSIIITNTSENNKAWLGTTGANKDGFLALYTGSGVNVYLRPGTSYINSNLHLGGSGNITDQLQVTGDALITNALTLGTNLSDFDSTLIVTGSAITTGNLATKGSISASGQIFGRLEETDTSGLKAVVYDPVGGGLYRTGSYNSGDGEGFPFSGSAEITGSLLVSGSFVDFTNAPLTASIISASGNIIGNSITSSTAQIGNLTIQTGLPGGNTMFRTTTNVGFTFNNDVVSQPEGKNLGTSTRAWNNLYQGANTTDYLVDVANGVKFDFVPSVVSYYLWDGSPTRDDSTAENKPPIYSINPGQEEPTSYRGYFGIIQPSGSNDNLSTDTANKFGLFVIGQGGRTILGRKDYNRTNDSIPVDKMFTIYDGQTSTRELFSIETGSGATRISGSTTITGNLTASATISSSGNLFADVTDNSDTSFKTVMYDPTTGQFFRTGSYAPAPSSVATSSFALTASYIEASNIDQPFTDITASGNISASGTIDGLSGSFKSLFVTGSLDVFVNLPVTTEPKFRVGRTPSQSIGFGVGDYDNIIVAKQDPDSGGHGNQNFILNRDFDGGGTNNFKIQKDGIDQFVIDTSGNISVSGNISASEFIGLVTTAQTASYIEASNIDQPFTDITASGNISASGDLYVRDGRFTRGTAEVEIIGSTSEGIIGTETNHNLLLRRNNIEKLRIEETRTYSSVGISVTGSIIVSGSNYILAENVGRSTTTLVEFGNGSSTHSNEDTDIVLKTVGSGEVIVDIGGNDVIKFLEEDIAIGKPFRGLTIASGSWGDGSLLVTGSITVSGSEAQTPHLKVIGDISASGDIIGNTGSFNRLEVNNSSFLSGSVDIVSSGSNIFNVQGSQGQLFSIDDDLLHNLFLVNDISGEPLFKISGSGLVEVLTGSITTPQGTINELTASHAMNIQPENNFTPIVEHSTNFTSTSSYAGHYNIVGGDLSITVTTGSENLTPGTEWQFFQSSSIGSFTFTSDTGVSVISRNNNKRLSQLGSTAILKYISGQTFHLVGDLTI